MSGEELSIRLGRNIRFIRQRRGTSQEALALSCGLHRTYIGAVERGERNITLLTLQKIASALMIEPVDLLQEPEHWSLQTRTLVNKSLS